MVRIVSLTTGGDIHITCLSNEAKYASPLLPEWFNLLIYKVMRSDLLCNLRQVTKAMIKELKVKIPSQLFANIENHLLK